MSTITQAQYDKVCEAIDRAKMDDRSLDTDEYAGLVLEALGVDIAPASGELVLNLGSRPATVEEVESLLWGSGSLSWPWWQGCDAELRDGVAGWLFTHDTEDEPEGTFTGRTWVSHQQILDAVGRFIREGRLTEDSKDILTESIGYFDAEAGDVVLQYAVFGKGVFG